jgi:hypothetical protein
MKGYRSSAYFIVALQEFDYDFVVNFAISGSGVCQGFCLKQKSFHLGGPRLFLNYDKRLEFAKVMGIAQRMLDTFHFEIRSPVIVHDKPAYPCQKITPARRDPEVAQERRTDHM